MSNKLNGAVGESARNRPDDVRLVQAELNKRVAALDMPALALTGVSSPALVSAIRRFQRFCMGLTRPDGRVQPGTQTERELFDGIAVTRQCAIASAAAKRLSGTDWWHAHQAEHPDSAAIVELAPAFAERVQSFVAALRRAGATVAIDATRHSRERAYLMHYSWQLAHGAVPPGEVPREEGVVIEWDHDSLSASQAGARAMAELFGITSEPLLTSNHTRGTAVDMRIDWSRPIDVVDGRGRTRRLDRPRSDAANVTLHDIGASYGVRKLLTSASHWSIDGQP